MTQPVEDTRYVVAAVKPWNRRIFAEQRAVLPGHWTLFADRADLTLERLEVINPRYVFFLHWSWKVPEEIFGRYECVCFHMTDVPYGRGGSPLQNLIERGHRSTMLTALRMVEGMDAGPVYLKHPLSLEGGAEEIYIRASRRSFEMIREIVHASPTPVPQVGEAVTFPRRHPDQSEIGHLPDIQSVFDFIRMLDADGYPRAFLECHGLRYEFSRPALRDGRVHADVTIEPVAEGS